MSKLFPSSDQLSNERKVLHTKHVLGYDIVLVTEHNTQTSVSHSTCFMSDLTSEVHFYQLCGITM